MAVPSRDFAVTAIPHRNRARCYGQNMKGNTDKAVEKIDAILEGYFSSLPPLGRAQKERAFIKED